MTVRLIQFGNVTLTWTEPMTAEELADLEELVAIWLRGVKRRVEALPAPAPDLSRQPSDAS